MSRYIGNSDRCPHCGLTYQRFRTGLTYEEVFLFFWTSSDDPSEWRYKKRNTVLGKWHQLKKEAWKHHLEECAERRKWEEAWEEKGYPPEWDEPLSEELL